MKLLLDILIDIYTGKHLSFVLTGSFILVIPFASRRCSGQELPPAFLLERAEPDSLLQALPYEVETLASRICGGKCHVSLSAFSTKPFPTAVLSV